MHPVAEAMENHFPNDGVIAVDRISTPGIIFIVPFVVFQHVVNRILKPFKAQDWSTVVSFAGMVEDDIQDDFNSCFMQGLNHLLEFNNLGARF